MVQGYYTLEEAARILGMGTEDLSQMAQRREVRAFADRGTWRFRTQDIEELARRRGLGSNPDVPLGEAPAPRPHDSPTHRGDPAAGDPGVFNFSLGGDSDQVEIGQEIISETPSGAQKVAGGKGSSSRRLGGPKTPAPKPGSDSDVRLVADGSDLGFQLSGEKTEPDQGPKSSVRKKAPPKQDSGVRLVPMEAESDSDVKIVPDSKDDVSVLGSQPPKSGTDSDIRLESPTPRRPTTPNPEDSFLTEEIDLDAELRAAEEAATQSSQKMKRPQKPAQPTPSPFELSDADLKLPKEEKAPTPAKQDKEDSSDFDLSLESKEDLSPLELSSGEMASLSASEEEVSLGDMPSGRVTGGSDSGINLQEPADSGISLEQGSDSSEEIEFELSLDAESTPKPAKAAPNVDSSSEFELTLEDSARLAPLEEEKPAAAAEGEDKDIFETDFEVPALEDESGSQVAALDESDTDLESSDFDLALGEEDAATEEESGSQVVALEDEEEVDEGAATIARPRGASRAAVADDEEAGDLLAPDDLEADDDVVGRRTAVVVGAPANWGIFTPVVLLLSGLLMFMVGLMSLELLHGMWGYRQPYKVPSMVIRSLGGLMPWVDAKDLDKD